MPLDAESIAFGRWKHCSWRPKVMLRQSETIALGASPDSSVANGGFAPLCGAAATLVAALKTPVASERRGATHLALSAPSGARLCRFQSAAGKEGGDRGEARGGSDEGSTATEEVARGEGVQSVKSNRINGCGKRRRKNLRNQCHLWERQCKQKSATGCAAILKNCW